MESPTGSLPVMSPKEIGYKLAFTSISFGLGIALVIWCLLAGAAWLSLPQFVIPFVLAIITMYVSGYFFGGIAGHLIIVKRYASGLIGIACGFVVTWTATLAGSLPGFLFSRTSEFRPAREQAFDYIAKPLCWVTAFGFVPIIVVGVIYGIAVDNRWTNYVKLVKETTLHESSSE